LNLSDSQRENLRRITEDIVDLPTLPVVVVQIMEMVDNPKTSAADLTRLISSDQSLTAKMLKLANSAFYGFPRRIGTIGLAVVVLGFDTIKNLVLSISVLEKFSRSRSGQMFDRMGFWEHSIGCGVAGRFLARKLGYRVSGEAFVAGLLHDLGKLILSQYLVEEFSQCLQIAIKDDLFIRDAEKTVLGVTHAEVGGWLAEEWNLPRQLVEAIHFHHNPARAKKDRELVALTHLADVLCRAEKVGFSGDSKGAILDPEALEIFSINGKEISEDTFVKFKDGFREELSKAAVFNSMIRR